MKNHKRGKNKRNRVATKKPVKKKNKRPVIKAVKKVTKKPPLKTKTKTGQKKRISRVKRKESEDNKKAALRRVLILKREEIVKEAKSEISKYIKGETRQLVDTALDNGDWSIVDLSEDISFKQLGIHRETLVKIDEALRKLDEGTYGKCEDCGEDINEERLKVLPYAIYCIDCKEKREQLEKMESKEGPV